MNTEVRTQNTEHSRHRVTESQRHRVLCAFPPCSRLVAAGIFFTFCVSCSFYSAKQCFAAKNESAQVQTVEPSTALVRGEPNNVSETDKTELTRIDSILDKLNKSTQELKSYQCEIEYKYVQPSVFDAQTIRKGMLYYSKAPAVPATLLELPNPAIDARRGRNESGKSLSKLRVNFKTLQQDEDKEQKYEEQYIIVDGAALVSRASSLVLPGMIDDGREITDERRFKGLWLVQLDYDLKNCKYIQLTQASEPNKPVDVFELVSRNLPIIGFTKTDRLKEEFDISAAPRDGTSGGLIQVQLKVKPNSVYKDDYVQIDCVIDEKLNLPVKITAISTEPTGETPENKDLYEIKFINAQINEKIDEKVFDFEIPKDFDKPDVYPLEN